MDADDGENFVGSQEFYIIIGVGVFVIIVLVIAICCVRKCVRRSLCLLVYAAELADPCVECRQSLPALRCQRRGSLTLTLPPCPSLPPTPAAVPTSPVARSGFSGTRSSCGRARTTA